MDDNYEWYTHLQALSKQAIMDAYRGTWKYSLIGDRGMAIDIPSLEGLFDIETVEYAENEEELKIYAKIDESITSLYELQQSIYQVLRIASEDYLVFIPLHTPELFQFWFMTGFPSHGHIVRIIINRSNHPHIKG